MSLTDIEYKKVHAQAKSGIMPKTWCCTSNANLSIQTF